MKILLAFVLSGILLFSCKYKTEKEEMKSEIIQTEKAFENMVAGKGLAEAFFCFADENAVIKRLNDTLISGRENIKAYYTDRGIDPLSLTWTPEFVDVSDDGTLAYTYGRYIWKALSETNDTVKFEGVFHTIWKKQKDGSWKYVWD
ncbi:YybH family protein [Saccharicrinis sp. FJH62]|uniref:YybH family protein n=1 Tax=Saccharicrinis sp. FJH62 TaxID=3344657 RepID=UPI0035D40E58